MSVRAKFAAAAVHVLTATGAVIGLQALTMAAAGRFEAAFAWLGLALMVDGIDGPLARRFDVKNAAPRFSGERLDLIIDYLNYVVTPAFIVQQAGIAPDGLGAPAAALILLVSLFHFSDRLSKTADGYFAGFPAIWNIAVFYLFAIPVSKPAALAIIVLLAMLTFIPVKWAHPFRVKSWRPATLIMTVAGSAAAAIILFNGFPARTLPQAVLLIAAFYFLCLGFSRTYAGE